MFFSLLVHSIVARDALLATSISLAVSLRAESICFIEVAQARPAPNVNSIRNIDPLILHYLLSSFRILPFRDLRYKVKMRVNSHQQGQHSQADGWRSIRTHRHEG